MSSLSIARQQSDPDELVLYLATAVALGAALFATGSGTGSTGVGAAGAALAAIGVYTGWRTRHWPASRRLPLGLLGALLGAGAFRALLALAMGTEGSAIYQSSGEVGTLLALRISVFIVALSFLLISRDALPLSLVPSVTMFGLAGGLSLPSVAVGCFLVFLSAALIALGQAMLLTGARARWRAIGAGEGASSWRRRHWSLLGALITIIIGLGSVIYLPVFTYGTRYYLPLAMMALPTIPSPGGSFTPPAGIRSGRPRAFRVYQVGQGPVAPGDAPVLSFTGDPAPLWRGEVFDSYTGNAWRLSDETRLPPPILNGKLDLQQWFPPTSPAALITRSVRVEREMPLVIHSPGQVEQASVPLNLTASAPRVGVGRIQAAARPAPRIVVDRFGCLSAPGATLPAGAEYQIASDALDVRAPLSARPSPDSSPLRPASLSDNPSAGAYLDLPLSSRRVADLARGLTATAASTDGKVAALVSYLQRECTYTLSAPAVPVGQDAADFLLFNSKQGYCDLFATAFAVMARAAGIPSRFVTGYAGGQYDPETKRYVLRESDAHAWVEIHQPPYGWVAVDPTPGGGPTPSSPFQQLLASASRFARRYPLARLGLSALALSAVGIAIMLLLRRRAARAELALDRNDPRAIVLRAYARLTRTLARRGRPRLPAQTPLEYLEATVKSRKSRDVGTPLLARPVESRESKSESRIPNFESLISNLAFLTDLFLLARYSPHPITPEAASLALSHLSEATQALRAR